MKKLLLLLLLFVAPFASNAQKINLNPNQLNYGLYVIDTGYVEKVINNTGTTERTKAETKFPIYVIISDQNIVMMNNQYNSFNPSGIKVLMLEDGLNYSIDGDEVMLAYPNESTLEIFTAYNGQKFLVKLVFNIKEYYQINY